MKLTTVAWSLSGALAFAGLLVASANTGRRATPQPPGLVFRLVEPEAGFSWADPWFTVEVASVDPPTIAVLTRDDDPEHGERWMRKTYEYPSGRSLEARYVDRLGSGPPPRFDFDADGIEDELERGCDPERGRVRVLSGASGAVLFEQRDELEYEDCERAFALGDLDHDGFAELALVHPRKDRSRYDPALWDALLGVNSWVTVVSGARALGR